MKSLEKRQKDYIKKRKGKAKKEKANSKFKRKDSEKDAYEFISPGFAV